MLTAIRTLVSGKRQRFCDDEFDLDLTYITEHIIAMGYPAEGYVDSVYRNSAADVDRALTKYHGDAYFVFNLAWRPYACRTLFHGHIMDAGCLDHHPMPLERLLSLLHKMDEWLHPSSEVLRKERRVVLHCMAGKGRTGMVVASYLVYIGMLLQDAAEKDIAGTSSSESIDALAAVLAARALTYFNEKRGGGVDHRSQMRYVEYVCKCALRAKPWKDFSSYDMRCASRPVAPPAPPRVLECIRFSHMPNYSAGCVPVVHILALPCQQHGMSDVEEGMGDGTGVGCGEHLIYNSSWVSFGNAQARSNSVSIRQTLSRDILLRILYYHESMSVAELMFRVAFNTGFVNASGLLTFPLLELDDVANVGLDSDFSIELQFESLEPIDQCDTSISGSGGTSTSLGLPGADGAHCDFRSNEELVRIGFLELQETSVVWGESWRLVWCVIQPDNLIVFSSKAATRPDLQRPLANSNVRLAESILTVTFEDDSLTPVYLRSSRDSHVMGRWLEECDSAVSMLRWMDAFSWAGARRQATPEQT